MNICKLISTWIKQQREGGVEIGTKEVGLLFDFGYWLESAAAQQSMHLTALGRALGVSLLVNFILLAVLAYAIGGR